MYNAPHTNYRAMRHMRNEIVIPAVPVTIAMIVPPTFLHVISLAKKAHSTNAE
jgi:uncharacterized protein with HEPN domain